MFQISEDSVRVLRSQLDTISSIDSNHVFDPSLYPTINRESSPPMLFDWSSPEVSQSSDVFSPQPLPNSESFASAELSGSQSNRLSEEVLSQSQTQSQSWSRSQKTVRWSQQLTEDRKHNKRKRRIDEPTSGPSAQVLTTADSESSTPKPRGRPPNPRKLLISHMSVALEDGSTTFELDFEDENNDETEDTITDPKEESAESIEPKNEINSQTISQSMLKNMSSNEPKTYEIQITEVFPELQKLVNQKFKTNLLIPVLRMTTKDLILLDQYLDEELPPLTQKEAKNSGFKNLDHFKKEISHLVKTNQKLVKDISDEKAMIEELTKDLSDRKKFRKNLIKDIKSKRWCERNECFKEVTDFNFNTEIRGTNGFGIHFKRKQFFCSDLCLTLENKFKRLKKFISGALTASEDTDSSQSDSEETTAESVKESMTTIEAVVEASDNSESESNDYNRTPKRFSDLFYFNEE